MREHGATRARWSVDDRLVELELGSAPGDEVDLDARDAEQERRAAENIERRRQMMLAAVPGVRNGTSK